ncbi:helix-turn-helix domain-containing protein [Nocardia sp. NPDC051570]|uniref:helix-turn-helix domain-containing protein n=1 Tax=Nocardia sp. NPDC051570 TaxID=3364324 RepID=UPI0037B4D68A
MHLTSHETLKALMRQRGMTLDALARATGCSIGHLSQLRSGRRNSCSPELAAKITEALAVPADLLFVPRGRAGSAFCVRCSSELAGAGAR